MSDMLYKLVGYHSKLNIPQNADLGPHFAFYETVMRCLPATAPNL